MGRYAAGVINHKSYDELGACLESLARQSVPPTFVRVIDSDGDPAAASEFVARFPSVRWSIVPNGGFGAGVNRVLAEARADPYFPDSVLVLNPDIELEPTYAEHLVDELQSHPRAAIASGKLLRPGGTRIDSAGIAMPRHRRPYDRGSFDEDRGQFDRAERVFAVCGAAMMLKVSALGTLEVDGQVFDESFFAYREDTDLCWRANLLGLSVHYVPTARAIHGRRWKPESRASRKAMRAEVRCHSFKNYYLQILKNESGAALVRDLPAIMTFEVAKLIYALVWDRSLLAAYKDALRHFPQAWVRRRTIQARRVALLARRSETAVRQQAQPAAEVELVYAS